MQFSKFIFLCYKLLHFSVGIAQCTQLRLLQHCIQSCEGMSFSTLFISMLCTALKEACILTALAICKGISSGVEVRRTNKLTFLCAYISLKIFFTEIHSQTIVKNVCLHRIETIVVTPVTSRTVLLYLKM